MGPEIATVVFLAWTASGLLTDMHLESRARQLGNRWTWRHVGVAYAIGPVYVSALVCAFLLGIVEGLIKIGRR